MPQSTLAIPHLFEEDSGVVVRIEKVEVERQGQFIAPHGPIQMTKICRRRLKSDPPCRSKSDPGMGPARWLPAVDNSTSLLVLS